MSEVVTLNSKRLLEALLHLHAARDAFAAGGYSHFAADTTKLVATVEARVMSGFTAPREKATASA